MFQHLDEHMFYVTPPAYFRREWNFLDLEEMTVKSDGRVTEYGNNFFK